MNITSNRKLLSLAYQSIDTALAPAVSGTHAQATLAILKQILMELLKREDVTPGIVFNCIAEGQGIAAEIAAFLGAPAQSIETPAADSRLSLLLAEHARLTRRLAVLCEELRQAKAAFADERRRGAAELLLRAANWEIRYPTEQQQAVAAAGDNSQAAATAPLSQETLQAFLQSVHPDGSLATVLNFEPLGGGFGKQTTRFVLRDAAGVEQTLIARKDHTCPMLWRGAFGLENEFHLVRAIQASGYLAPKPLWFAKDVAGVDAPFFISELLPGSPPGSFLGGLDDGDSQAMLLDVADRLAQLHALPLQAFSNYIAEWDDVSVLDTSVATWYRREIAQWQAYAQQVDRLDSPFMSYIFDWLENHVPEDGRPPVLVHGDFNVHNLLVQEGRVTGVLDWECALFGAPEQDLAYIQPHISKHIDWQLFVDRYRASGGREVQTENLPFYMAFSAMRMHIAILHAMHNLQNGINEDARYAMVEIGFSAAFMQLALASTAAVGK